MVWEGVVVRWGGMEGCSDEVGVWEGVVVGWGGMEGCSGEVRWYGRV